MKKARNAMLGVFISFICVVLGLFIGRYTARTQIVFFDSSSNNQQIQQTGINADSKNSAQTGKININTASANQLQMLPNIGEVLASRIIEYRTQFGPFITTEDLILVEGIGEKRMEELKDYITVGG